MAKEYVIEKAFQPKNDDGSVKSWNSTKGGEMHVWKVKVEGEDFWFDLNKKAGNVITPGDTIYGLFDEETVTPKDKSKEPFQVKKFVKLQRPDGAYDKVQARAGGESQTATAQTNPDIEARIARIENHLGLPPIEFAKDAAVPQEENTEEEELNLEDLPL